MKTKSKITTEQLQELQALFFEAFPQKQSYYALMPTSITGEKLFLFSHNMKHATKLAGKLASLAEDMDHTGAYPDKDEIRIILAKQVINMLLTAGNAGIDISSILNTATREARTVVAKENLNLSSVSNKCALKNF